MNILLVYFQAILMFISFFFVPVSNFGYWLFHFPSYNFTIKQKCEVKKNINTIEDIKKQIYQLKYEDDFSFQYEQYVTTTINKGLKGDCKDFARFGKFLFNCIGIESEIYYLVGQKNWKHVVCITKDKKYMISGNTFYEFKTNYFETELYNYFLEHYKYYYIFKDDWILVREFKNGT